MYISTFPEFTMVLSFCSTRTNSPSTPKKNANGTQVCQILSSLKGWYLFWMQSCGILPILNFLKEKYVLIFFPFNIFLNEKYQEHQKMPSLSKLMGKLFITDKPTCNIWRHVWIACKILPKIFLWFRNCLNCSNKVLAIIWAT